MCTSAPGMKDKRTNDDYCFDEAASMECLAAASICPPPQQTLVDDWVDPGDKNRSSVMQVLWQLEVALMNILRGKQGQECLCSRSTRNVFEEHWRRTSCRSTRASVEQIDLNPDIVEGFRATNSFQKSTAF